MNELHICLITLAGISTKEFILTESRKIATLQMKRQVRICHVKGIDQRDVDNKFIERYREWSMGGEYEEMDVRKNETEV